MTKRLTAVVAVAAVFAAATGLGGEGAGAAPTGSPRCYPKGSVTLRATERVRVYRPRSGDKVACFLPNGRRQYLELRPLLVVYPPPAISIAGRLLGYALEGQADPNDRDDDTRIEVFDMRTGDPPPDYSTRGAPFAVSDPNKYDGKVGSLKVKSNGAVAWIACRVPSDSSDYGNPRPACVRAGAFDEVRKLDAGKNNPRLLDRGRSIDPRSLRRHGSKITWISHGRRRSATLH